MPCTADSLRKLLPYLLVQLVNCPLLKYAGPCACCSFVVYKPVLSPRPQHYNDVARQFGDREGVAELSIMVEVSEYLREAKLVWMDENGARKTKQSCMTDLCKAVRVADKRSPTIYCLFLSNLRGMYEKCISPH